MEKGTREMNANELIDKLRSVSIKLLDKETEDAGRAIIFYRESAIMLRQQAEEIAMLKQIIDANNLQSDIGQLKKTREQFCNKCNNTGWVCEWHPNKEAHKCCGGAGMPCECTKESE